MHAALEHLKWNEDGLVPAIVQSDLGGEIRMLAWCNAEALEKTLETGKAHFYSRSRQAQWMKGESSGNTIDVRSVWVDCDGDTLIFLSDPNGPSCHTGEETCFFRRLDVPQGAISSDQSSATASPALGELAETLRARKNSDGDTSYTKRLLEDGVEKISDKIREEASELCEALADESEERVASEAADLLYHALVGLLARDVDPLEVVETLRARFGTSGLAEKASRKS